MLLRSLQRASQAAELLSPLLECQIPALSAFAPALQTDQQHLHLQQADQQQQQQQHFHSWRSPCIHQLQQQACSVSSLQSVTLQQCRQLLLSARHFTTSSSSCAEDVPASEAPLEVGEQQQEEQQQQEDLRKVLTGMPGRLVKQPIFTNNLSSKIKSRKPAIKYPARHQWRFCAEDYDPMEPFESQPLPPYAPLRAHTKDYNKIYESTKPKFHRKSYYRLWRKNMAIADQRWKMAWEKKLAAQRKEEAVIKKLSERIMRERSWQMWQVQQRQAGKQQA